MSSQLERLLGDLMAQAQLDVENELLDRSDDTRKIWDAIVERYGRVDDVKCVVCLHPITPGHTCIICLPGTCVTSSAGKANSDQSE